VAVAVPALFHRPRSGNSGRSCGFQNRDGALAGSAPFELEPQVARASFELRRPDLHALYDAIGQGFGIRIVYDRDLGTVPVSGDFRLQDVSLKEALDAAASITRTFVAPTSPRTAIVAADTPQKRGEYERQILGSFHMDNQLTPQQLSEISNALRNIVELRRVTQDSRTNWITVLGRSRQVEVAGQFVQTLDRPAGEVMFEIEVWEIDTNRARAIGISPPQPFALEFLGRSSEKASVPLLDWGNVYTLYGMQVPGLTAFLNSSESLVRTHQMIHLRASDGQEARLLVGSRIPVVTGDISSVILSENGTQPGANEGFIPSIQYQDVGVVIHATPHMHAAGEMTLQLDFALRAVGATADNGIPSFTNRQMTNQVRLGSREAYLLGGILTQNSKGNSSGYPWLSRLPAHWLAVRAAVSCRKAIRRCSSWSNP
jgi:general secretion pathway protein D